MLDKMRLVNFRAFKDFTISFGDGAFLVGPNNAGKSTILTALRTADTLLRYALRRNPDRTVTHHGLSFPSHPVSLRDFPALRDSLRYEFGRDEARIELTWKGGARLTAVWPEEDSGDEVEPFFFLERAPGLAIRTVQQARDTFPTLGVIPILNPLEHAELLLQENYVNQNVAGRLSSRHFRNQLRILSSQRKLEGFLDWSSPWLGDLEIDSLDQHVANNGMLLDVYYKESDSRIPKEVVWAGDGIQIWLQLLFHVYRVRECDTIILDEPEVYLHPDLQRRLVQLLESTGRQVVLATHSAEVVAEADARLITMIDKNRSRARRARSESDLEMLSATLGTAFNVRLARALRSRVAVFVEGQDMTVLRRFAKALGFTSLELERNITVIPLKGYTRWGQVEPFAWLCQEMLPEAIDVFVILDRDYRTGKTVEDVEKSFEATSVKIHIWERKELESYVLTPSVIARTSRAPLAQVEEWLNEITLSFESEVFSRLLEERMRTEVTAANHRVSVMTDFKTEFDGLWVDKDYRLQICPPKKVISALNTRLQEGGHKTISSAGLARSHKPNEISAEMSSLLKAIEAAS